MVSPTDRSAALAQRLAEHDLLTPALCLLTSHRPLAFYAGQLLYLLNPLVALLGQPTWVEWAECLTDPAGVDQLEVALAARAAATPAATHHHVRL
jgi:hypothetical protein